MSKNKNFYMSQLDGIFPNSKPDWLDMEFINRKPIHDIAINMKEDYGINLIVKGSKKAKEDLIFNTYYHNYINNVLIINKNTAYFDFEKELKYYFEGKKYLPKEMDKAKEDRSVRWIRYNQIIQRVEELVEKKFLIVNNIKNIDSEAKEKFLVEKLFSDRLQEGLLTFMMFNKSYKEISNQFTNKEYKQMFNFGYNSWFDILEIDKIIENS